MTPIRCTECKKYYDADKYDVCPHCSNAGGGNVQLPPKYYSDSATGAPASSPEKSKRKGLFSGKNKSEKHPLSLSGGVIPSEDPDILAQGGSGRNASHASAGAVNMHSREPQRPPVAAEPKRSSAPLPKPSIQEQKTQPIHRPAQPPVQTPVQQPVHPAEPPVQQPTEQTPPSIGAAVQQAASTQDEGKTIGMYNIPNASGAPVVGWLICVEGESVGECFNIRSGRNNVGRSVSMDISLVKEKSVSRERHCSITFEPLQKKFFIQAGESSGLTYVNGELVMTFAPLKDYDKILLGTSKFIFLRLVNNKFSWDEYIN